MEEQMIQRLIEVQNRSVRVLEEIAQLIARLDKKTPNTERENISSKPETSFTSVNLPSQINITNVPLPVNIENQPVSVEQSGDWTVSISDQPIQVNIENQPIQVSQSGTWSVAINNQPVSVTVTNFPLTVGYSIVQYAPINATTSGDTQIVGAVSGKRIRVIAYAVIASATVSIKFRSGTTDITGSMRVVEGGGIAHAYDGGLFQTAVNQPLNINLSNNATVGGYVVYREV
jgi:mRNA-degrading endonuclease HigB of HigAB toxin-antitoxin module